MFILANRVLVVAKIWFQYAATVIYIKWTFDRNAYSYKQPSEK